MSVTATVFIRDHYTGMDHDVTLPVATADLDTILKTINPHDHYLTISDWWFNDVPDGINGRIDQVGMDTLNVLNYAAYKLSTMGNEDLEKVAVICSEYYVRIGELAGTLDEWEATAPMVHICNPNTWAREVIESTGALDGLPAWVCIDWNATIDEYLPDYIYGDGFVINWDLNIVDTPKDVTVPRDIASA